MLRLLWASLRWDDMAVKPAPAVGTTRTGECTHQSAMVVLLLVVIMLLWCLIHSGMAIFRRRETEAKRGIWLFPSFLSQRPQTLRSPQQKSSSAEMSVLTASGQSTASARSFVPSGFQKHLKVLQHRLTWMKFLRKRHCSTETIACLQFFSAELFLVC